MQQVKYTLNLPLILSILTFVGLLVFFLYDLGIGNSIYLSKESAQQINITGKVELKSNDEYKNTKCQYTLFVEGYRVNVSEDQCEKYKEFANKDVELLGNLMVEEVRMEGYIKQEFYVEPESMEQVYIERCRYRQEEAVNKIALSCSSDDDCMWVNAKECSGCWNENVEFNSDELLSTPRRTYCTCIEGFCKHPDKNWISNNQDLALQSCVAQLDPDRCYLEHALLSINHGYCNKISNNEMRQECVDYFTKRT